MSMPAYRRFHAITRSSAARSSLASNTSCFSGDDEDAVSSSRTAAAVGGGGRETSAWSSSQPDTIAHSTAMIAGPRCSTDRFDPSRTVAIGLLTFVAGSISGVVHDDVEV